MEAMACETPVVGTEVGGIPTAVDAGETGYLVPKDGISELAGRMEELLGIRVSTNGWLKRLGRGPSSTIGRRSRSG